MEAVCEIVTAGNTHILKIEAPHGKPLKIYVDGGLAIEHQPKYRRKMALYALRIDGCLTEILLRRTFASFEADVFIDNVHYPDGELLLSDFEKLAEQVEGIRLGDLYRGRFKSLTLKWGIWFVLFMLMNFFISDMKSSFREDAFLTILTGVVVFAAILPLIILTEVYWEYRRMMISAPEDCRQKDVSVNEKYQLYRKSSLQRGDFKENR